MKTGNWFSRPIIALCRSKLLQNAAREHSAILSTFIMSFVIKIFVLFIFEWPLKTGFTLLLLLLQLLLLLLLLLINILKKKETSDFHGTVSINPVKMSQQK